MSRKLSDSVKKNRKESGRRIRELRLALNITQQELADLITNGGIKAKGDGDRTFIARIEKGELPIDVDNRAEILALYFNFKIKENPEIAAKFFPIQYGISFISAKSNEVETLKISPHIDKEYLTCEIKSYNKDIEEHINWEIVKKRQEHTRQFQDSLFKVMKDFGYGIKECASYPYGYYLVPSNQDHFNVTPVGLESAEIILEKDGKIAEIPFSVLHRALLDIAQNADSKFCQLLSRYSREKMEPV